MIYLIYFFNDLFNLFFKKESNSSPVTARLATELAILGFGNANGEYQEVEHDTANSPVARTTENDDERRRWRG